MADHYLIEPDKKLLARLHAACQVKPATTSAFDWREQPLIGDGGVVAREETPDTGNTRRRPEEA